MAYNGWTNYATWRVNLEIFDGYDASDLPRDPFDAAAALKDMAEELICGQAAGDESSLARDYALAFISDVNWREIATHMLGCCNVNKEQMDAIWNAPGVQNAGHLNIWYIAKGEWKAKPGRERKPAFDKELLRRARRDLPNWYAKRNTPWWLA